MSTGGWSASETAYSFAPSVRRREKTATETNEIGSQTARRANRMKRSLFILGIRFVQPHQPRKIIRQENRYKNNVNRMPIRVTKMYRYSHHVGRYNARYKTSHVLSPFMTTFIKKTFTCFINFGGTQSIGVVYESISFCL